MNAGRFARSWGVSLAVCGVPLLVAGCGPSRPEPVPVRGRITYDGNAVTNGSVILIPTEETLPEARGRLLEDGSFELTTFEAKDGALPGEYRVAIRAFKTGPGLDTSSAPPIPLVPRKYTSARTTPLVKTIEQRELNILEIQL